MRTKILSILIPVYNQETLIVKAINSIPKRDDLEIIVVDDASTDNTVQSVLNLNREDLTLIKVSKWQPTGFCRNLCMNAAKGQFIFWLDSDDVVDTNGFIKFIDFVYNHLNYDVIKISLLDNNKKLYDGRKKWSTCTKVSKLDTIRKYNITFPDILIAEDKKFWDKLKSHNISSIYYDKIFYKYNHPRKGSAM